MPDMYLLTEAEAEALRTASMEASDPRDPKRLEPRYIDSGANAGLYGVPKVAVDAWPQEVAGLIKKASRSHAVKTLWPTERESLALADPWVEKQERAAAEALVEAANLEAIVADKAGATEPEREAPKVTEK